MMSIDAPEYSRNYGFWDETEQQALIDAHVAIGGVGGDGFQLGQSLVRMGVQNLSIADPEVFEPENANRVPGANTETYGRSKADVFVEEAKRINPDVNIRIFKDGVTPDNVSEFLEGATLVYDETELRYLHVGTALAREARRRNIPEVLVMNIGFAALVTSFRPDRGMTFEKFMGIPEDEPLEEVAKREVDLSRCVPYLPKYGSIATLQAVEQGAPLPSIKPGVDAASGMGATQGFLHIVSAVNNKRPEPVWAPKVAYTDFYTMQSGTSRFSRLSHYKHLVHMAARDLLHRNPKASFTDADRARRESSRQAAA